MKALSVRLNDIEYENLKIIANMEQDRTRISTMSLNQMARIFISAGIEKYLAENEVVK